MSRTLSRLRDRSRSKSTSRSSRGGSRPRSLVLLGTTSELGDIRNDPLQVDGIGGGDTGIQGSRDDAISPWGEPPATPRKVDQEADDGVPERLGILPSPTAATFTSHVDSPPKSAGSAALAGSEENVRPLDSTLEQHQFYNEDGSAANLLESATDEETTVEPGFENVRDLDSSTREEAEEDELYTSTPVASRKPTVGLPADDVDDELYETTPKAVQRPWASDQEPTITECSADDGMDESTLDRDAADGDAEHERTVGDSGYENALATEDGSKRAEADLIEEQGEKEFAQDERTESNPPYVPNTEGYHDLAPPPAGDDDDKGSPISAENHNHNVVEEQTAAGAETASRRSSVSSLGDQEQHHVTVQPPDEEHKQPIMSSQAVPAGPIGDVSPVVSRDGPSADTSFAGEDKFMNRTYLSRPAMPPRPLSYELLERDSQGEMVPETLNTKNLQQSAKEQEDEDWRASTAFNTTTLTRHRKVSLPTPDRKSKRFSGVSKEYETESQPPEEEPLPAVIPVDRGLENLPAPQPKMVEPTPQAEMQQQDDKQSRRKSGLWEAFRRSPSISKDDTKAETRLGRSTPKMKEQIKLPPPPPLPVTSRQEQPQRASTTATEPEKKKKRFSGLGSLFGRSSTTGHKREDSKKLSKSSQSRNEKQSKPPQPSSPDIYDEDDDDIAPPPHGWYAPLEDPTYDDSYQRYPPPQQIYEAPRATPPRPGGDTVYSNIPESFRPTDAGYGRYVRPIGPPDAYQHPGGMYSQSNSHIGMDSSDRQTSNPQMGPYPHSQFDSRPPQLRQPSFGPGFDTLSPQISGQSEWERSDRQSRGSLPTISPVQTRSTLEQYPSSRDVPLSSVREETPQSPPMRYASQPVPARPSLPQAGRESSGSSTRTSYYARQRRAKPSQPGDMRPGDGYSLPPLDMGRPMQNSTTQQHGPGLPVQYGQAISSDTRIPHNARIGSLSAVPDGQYQPGSNTSYQQRSPSGPGRYEPSEEDESPMMRGVSYPGQEWMPQWE